ncbi:MAG: ABC transporter permease [Candidatus Ancillula trichonymphae]|nr:ABC transporter permease [Candidatus Ancillula trichonymphae]
MIILFATSLACIVLYNLININITERTREIATLKVLGFYNRETSAYVFRENNMHTALGIGLGLIFGVTAHMGLCHKFM